MVRNSIRGREKGCRKGIFNTKDSGYQMNDKDETSEEGYNGYVNGERDSGSKRREWRSGHTKGICVIWCVKIHSGTWLLKMLA